MKNILTLCLALFSIVKLGAQAQNPVTWMTTYKAISATEGEVTITAAIQKGWHTYSQRPTDAGPISTTFTFPDTIQYTLVGKTEESNAHEEFDKAFEAKLFSFTDKAVFTQKIKFAKPGFNMAFKVEYVCCNESMCLPPKTVDLHVKVQ